MRVYEYAKKYDLASGDLVKIFNENGFSVKSHMSVLGEKELHFIETYLEKQKAPEAPLANKKQQESQEKSGFEKKEFKESIAGKVEKSSDAVVADFEKSIVFEESVQEIQLSGSTTQANQPLGYVTLNEEAIDELNIDIVAENLARRDEPKWVDEEDFLDEEERLVARKLAASKARAQQASENNRKKKKRRFNHADRRRKATLEPDVSDRPDIDLSAKNSLAIVAKAAGVSLVEMINFFIKRAKFYSVNSLVPSTDIELAAQSFPITIKKVEQVEAGKGNLGLAFGAEKSQESSLVPRSPVVVIMGHVDHGKTTLIDYIRKTSIADKEKGGITQSVRVYPVKAQSGSFIVIDTPGHEAFSLMRKVGAKITDVAVIIVAADDGVMPQTVESIQIAKEMNATIVIAINKIDKPGVEANVDKIKQSLAKYDVIVEDWGGDVVCMPISAKTGKGVSELLEMVFLQADLLDLKTSEKVPAQAFVLESFIEKGLGACAVVISTQGMIKVGDNFIAGSSVGKVKAIFDVVSNKKVNALAPYHVGKVVGFSEVATTGDVFKYMSHEAAVAKEKENTKAFSAGANLSVSSDGDVLVKVILKADSFGVLNALSELVTNLGSRNSKLKNTVAIVEKSVGNIYEKDVIKASENGAIILGMNINLEKTAQIASKELGVEVKVDGIIYRITDFLESRVIDVLKSKKELKQIGTGVVKKVFDIKGRGVIAGCLVKDGIFAEKSVVYCLRGGVKVGEGRMTSLQQNKKTSKEISAGDDCGFICQGFSSWVEGDKVICFSEVSSYND